MINGFLVSDSGIIFINQRARVSPLRLFGEKRSRAKDKVNGGGGRGKLCEEEANSLSRRAIIIRETKFNSSEMRNKTTSEEGVSRGGRDGRRYARERERLPSRGHRYFPIDGTD